MNRFESENQIPLRVLTGSQIQPAEFYKPHPSKVIGTIPGYEGVIVRKSDVTDEAEAGVALRNVMELRAVIERLKALGVRVAPHQFVLHLEYDGPVELLTPVSEVKGLNLNEVVFSPDQKRSAGKKIDRAFSGVIRYLREVQQEGRCLYPSDLLKPEQFVYGVVESRYLKPDVYLVDLDPIMSVFQRTPDAQRAFLLRALRDPYETVVDLEEKHGIVLPFSRRELKGFIQELPDDMKETNIVQYVQKELKVA